MVLVPLGIAAGALLGALAYLDHHGSLRRLQRWQEAAARLGLRHEGDKNERTIQGRRRGVPVQAHYERQVQQVGKYVSAQEKTTLYAGGDGEIPRTLSLEKSALRRLGDLVPSRDARIGDAEFDRFVQLPQLDEYVCAALSHEARTLLLQLLRQGGEVREGVLWLVDQAGSDHDQGWLEQQLDALALLGAELSVLPSTLHRRLALNARTDPSPGVRLTNLRFLSRPSQHTSAELLRNTARALLGDPDVDVRSLAACQLGAEGFPALRAIANDRSLDAAPRVTALEALGQADAPGLLPLLGELLSQPGSPELLVAVLTGVATLQLGSLRDAVLTCSKSPHDSVRAAAARTLGKLVAAPVLLTPADSRAAMEQRLWQLLADPSDEVQLASAEALGEVGSVRAVEPLLELTRGLLGRGALRQAARAAITQIQSRLGNVDAGRVSLADAALEGAVALSEAAALRDGRLSSPTAAGVSLAEQPPGESEGRASGVRS